MTQDGKRYRLAEIQRSLAALPDELRTISKATLPDTAERAQVIAALNFCFYQQLASSDSWEH